MSNPIQDNMIAAVAEQAKNIPAANTDIVEVTVVAEGDVILAPRKDVAKANSEVDNDASFARQNIYDLVTKGMEALDQMGEIARQSQHPRAFEVYATLLKNLSDVNDRLLATQKSKKDLKKDDEQQAPPEPQDPNINIEKAVFVGTASELLDQIKASKKK